MPLSSDDLAFIDTVRDVWKQPQLVASEAFLAGSESDQKRLIDQLRGLDETTPGGVLGYLERAKKLLEDSAAGVNPFEGFRPEVPEGSRLSFPSKEFDEMEKVGDEQLPYTCFCLVAGGLGERLGYSGIKLQLPTQLETEWTYLEYYCRWILAIQKRARTVLNDATWTLPLAIMTSDDTHQRTVELLEENEWFGMDGERQVILLKQEKVPALSDSHPHISLSPSDAFAVQTKPHGHGDVHSLLERFGVAEKWEKEGRKWLLFFQDTNALVFNALRAFLGVSAAHSFDMNSLTVPRRAGEAAGGICRLVGESGDAVTINVEYNQLDPLLRATTNPAGDVADPETGLSPFPGNLNVLLFSLSLYTQTVREKGATCPEFVNPKYADKEKTMFKAPTRLECMMQDFPKLFAPTARVGFTQMDRFLCFSPVKNSYSDAQGKAASGLPEDSASSGERDMYEVNRRVLGDVYGVRVPETCRVLMSPGWHVFAMHDKPRFPHPENIHLGENSTLLLDGDHITIESLSLSPSSALCVRSGPRSSLSLSLSLSRPVENEGHHFRYLSPGDFESVDIPEYVKIRGYDMEKRGEREIFVEEEGDVEITE